MTSTQKFTSLLAFFAVFWNCELEAHPAHAKPVNYPYVVGFERFHSSLDDDEYLARGGLILLNELNCVACHAPPEPLAPYLNGVVATDLEGVASRLSPVNIEIMIRNPRFMKKDTVMPSLFAGPDRDLEEVEALKHFLSSLKTDIPSYEVGDIEAGRAFYHRVGCAACHAPEVGYRPPGVPENAEIELAGLPSVPMNLADLYHIDAVAHFLLHPNKHRPSGRMPDFNLTEKEATDLAAYLKAGPDLVLPENLSAALGASEGFEIDPVLVEKGKALFSQKSCSACHETPGTDHSLEQGRALAMADLDPDSEGGCFSERPLGGPVPFYGLDVVQKRAIAEALRRIDVTKPFDTAGEIDWRMKRLNCYACHERDGIGGAETAREVYFGFQTEEAKKMGLWGNLPPMLDRVGARLTDSWLEKVMTGHPDRGSVRNYMMARMPLYPAEKVQPFLEQLPEVDLTGDAEKGGLGLFGGRSAELGHQLLGAEGKQCISCHDIGSEKATEWPGIDLAIAPARLRRSYFDRLLLNPQETIRSIPMPDQFEDNKEYRKELDAMWSYLKQINSKEEN